MHKDTAPTCFENGKVKDIQDDRVHPNFCEINRKRVDAVPGPWNDINIDNSEEVKVGKNRTCQESYHRGVKRCVKGDDVIEKWLKFNRIDNNFDGARKVCAGTCVQYIETRSKVTWKNPFASVLCLKLSERVRKGVKVKDSISLFFEIIFFRPGNYLTKDAFLKRTRRERLKSALYLRLKKRKVSKNVKGGPFCFFNIHSVAK